MKSIYFFLSAFLFLPGHNAQANEFAAEKNDACTVPGIFSDVPVKDDFSTPPPPILTRGPYLQMGTQTGIIIRWRTDIAENSRVRWGTAFGSYTNTVDSATLTTEHVVQISGLTPDTRYWYTIGSSTQTLQATNTNYFLTLPPANTTRKLRFLALGDCGNASTNQVDVKNAALSYLGSNDLDALLTIGDNAYNSGLDTEFQIKFFDIYKDDLMRNKKLYMNPGNHDYGNSSTQTGNRNNDYYKNFTLPTAGEIGGQPSGTEAYYSYDVGDVHLISLDSYGRENSNTTKLYDTLGAQTVWLKNDLAANTKKWVVVYFHHPPYTKTSHNSDTETADLMLIRERFIRILERYGVDLVMCGHSHGYERSYLLKQYYNNPSAPLLDANFNASTHTATGNNQNAKYDGTANSCAYDYNSGKYDHGSVYVVAGSAGQVGGTSAGYPHNAMYYSNATNGGSFYFEVDSNRLDAKFISYSGTGGSVVPVIRDQFTIFKDVKKVTNISIVQHEVLHLTASWRGTYYWPGNGGATSQSVTVNTSIPGIYSFTVQDAASNHCLEDSFYVLINNGSLPVLITSFNALAANDKVLLNWTTSQELQNRYFTMERSGDGVNFSFLTRIGGDGTTTETRNYQAVDHAPLEGSNFYRLSQTDVDGRINYHGVKRVNFKNSSGFSAGIINKGNNRLSVVVNSIAPANIHMHIVDMNGKMILQEKFPVLNGGTVKELQVERGIYILVLSNLVSGERISKKIIAY